MTPSSPRHETLAFGSFTLDLDNQVLVGDDGEVALTPKAFALLSHFAHHPRQLLTKRDLLATVWADTIVGDAALKVCVREIRKALGDDVKQPLYVETLHRRGYRFLPEVVRQAPRAAATPQALVTETVASRSAAHDPVGRAPVVTRLADLLHRAESGERQVVFVAGSQGMGKTTVAELFLERVVQASDAGWQILRGHALEHLGQGEEFLPLLDALGSLGRQGRSEELAELLERHAPNCLIQIPSLLTPERQEELRRRVDGTAPARLLREMADALEALARTQPTLVLLEDLHWADEESLALLSLIAGRREASRLMILASFRPGHASVALSELAASGRTHRIDLALLEVSDVALYLQQHRDEHPVAPETAATLHRLTEGHPLLLANFVEELVREDLLHRDENGHLVLEADPATLETRVPTRLRELVERRIARHSDEDLEILEAASVAGIVGDSFSTVSIGAALGRDPEPLEVALERLARPGTFIRMAGTIGWDDGTLGAAASFVHRLYQQVLYDRISEVRRKRMHLRIAERGRELYAERIVEVAHELALHLERGDRPTEAATAWRLAADHAMSGNLNREATAHLDRALALRERLPDETVMDLLEARARLHHLRGRMLEAEADIQDQLGLARAAGDVDREIEALVARSSVCFWTDRTACLDTIEEARHRSRFASDPLIQAHARGYHGHLVLNLTGWTPEAAAACREAEARAAEADDTSRLCFHVSRNTYLACLEGDYDGAQASCQRGLALARSQTARIFDSLLNLFWGTWAAIHTGAWGPALVGSRRGRELAERNDNPSWRALFRIMHAHLLVEVGAADAALRSLEEPEAFAREAGSVAGQVLYHAGIVGGLARNRKGDHEGARETLSGIADALHHPDREIDRLLLLPLELGLAEALIGLGDHPEARPHAEKALEMASLSGERFYAALAQGTLARIEAHQGARDAARKTLRRAFTTLDEEARGQVDPAALRLHALRLEIPVGGRAFADPRAAIAACIERLADSLGDEPDTRATWLASPGVQRLREAAS